MRNTIKSMIAAFAFFAVTGFAQAQDTVIITESDAMHTNLDPGYAEVVELASIPELDDTIAALPEFQLPTNYMSDAGVYRYAYWEKTDVWLTRAEAEAAMRTETSIENL